MAAYALLPNLKKSSIFCHRRGIEFFCHLCSTQQHRSVFVSHSWPAPATYSRPFCEHCDQRWIGAPEERAPLRFHGPAVSFVDRCLSRTRNLAASNNIWLEFLRPILAQHLPRNCCFVFFFQVWIFFVKICAHSERYRNLMALIFEFKLFFGNIAFPLSSVSPTPKKNENKAGKNTKTGKRGLEPAHLLL